jgi:hypothetical protein
MNRYAIATFLLALIGTPAVAQYPLTGAFPPWSPGVPPPTAYSPKEVPILTQTPVKYMLTDQVFTELQGIVPFKDLVKLNSIQKGKEFTLKELMVNIDNVLVLTADEVKKMTKDEINKWKDDVQSWKQLISYYSQISAPRFIEMPAGKPLVGYYKMDNLLVGADGRYPFDSGEYNLSGFAGNARIYGTFAVTLPRPTDVDPRNAPLYYCSYRGLFQKMPFAPANRVTCSQP